MSTSLAAAVSSDYVGASNKLRKTGVLPEVYVYVEGIDDVSFWHACLLKFADRYKFKITQLKNPDGSLSEGKGHLLKSVGVDTLGPFKLVAIDSDYDWIIDNYKTSSTSSSLSSVIRDNKYILHTYLYSIENYKANPDCVRQFVVTLSNKVPDLDIKDYMEDFSRSLSELFLTHLVSAELCDGVFTLADFRSFISRIQFDKCQPKLTDESRIAISGRILSLKQYADFNRTKIDNYRSKLAAANFTPETYHFLFQGHIMCGLVNRDYFVNLILNLRNARIAEILSEGSDIQKCQRLAQFMSVTGIKSATYENNTANYISNAKHKEIIRDCLKQLFFYCSDAEKTPLGYSRIEQDLNNLFK